MRLLRRFVTTSASIRPELKSKALQSLLTVKNLQQFTPWDQHPALSNESNGNTVSIWPPPKKEESQVETSNGPLTMEQQLAQVTPFTPQEISNLYRFPLVIKRVVNMTGKGKIPSTYALVVVGNGQGLVGYGESSDKTADKAVKKAFAQGVRSMDYVERRDARTIWGDLKSSFGSTKIEMRERPPGFGLRVNPNIHQVAKAAGISDMGAKVHGSRNPTRVIKLAIAMLHGGDFPLDMGDFGKRGQKKNKKTSGMKTAHEVAQQRGRKVIIS